MKIFTNRDSKWHKYWWELHNMEDKSLRGSDLYHLVNLAIQTYTF